MAIDPTILRAMQAAGASIDVIIAAVEAAAAIDDTKVDDRRAKDAERQRRHRASRDVTVTVRDISDSVTSTPLSRPPNENKSNPPTHTPDKQTPARKGRLPIDWQPQAISGDLGKAIANWPDGAIARELERFRDWAASATGTNSIKLDWQAAWRNWLRKAQDDGRYAATPKQRNGFPGQGTTRDLGAEIAAEFANAGSHRPADNVLSLGPPGRVYG